VDRLGGTESLQAAVKGLMERMIGDPELVPFFDNSNLSQLKHHQASFLKIAFSEAAPDTDNMKYIRKSHAALILHQGLGEKHFDRMLSHFVDVLRDLDVSEPVVDEATLTLCKFRIVFEKQQELLEC
jgi:hemoglobin